MLKRLDDILKRYEFLSAQLADPAVISDMGTWQKYSKEHSEIGETAEKYLQYLACEKEMKEAFAQAETEGDKEMRQLFSDEGYACKEKLSALKEELKILLLPKDKNGAVFWRSARARAGRKRRCLRRSFAVCIRATARITA